MVNSPFFCQNLLSDYIEGMLPSQRHDEVKQYLEKNPKTRDLHEDLKMTLELLASLEPKAPSHELSLRITEAAQSGRRGFFNRARFSRAVMVLLVPLLLFGAVVVTFPTFFPFFHRFPAAVEEGQFVRYFPLLQGASEIIDEQANWLHLKEPFMRSLWEEGGLSPEEFEKTFQVRGTKSEKESQ